MITETKEITNSDDVIDVRDVIARVEELENALSDDEPDDAGDYDPDLKDEREELQRLTELLSDLKGNSGDEEWRDAWYPITLVRDSYFEDFARDEAESLDLVKSDARWPYTCIDWEQAARELQMDYSTVEFDGVTYYYR